MFEKCLIGNIEDVKKCLRQKPRRGTVEAPGGLEGRGVQEGDAATWEGLEQVGQEDVAPGVGPEHRRGTSEGLGRTARGLLPGAIRIACAPPHRAPKNPRHMIKLVLLASGFSGRLRQVELN